MSTTYDLASSQIATYVTPLSEGDPALSFETRDENGHMLKLTDDYLSGGHLLLIFINRVELTHFDTEFAAIAKMQSDYEKNNIKGVIITANSDTQKNRQMSRQYQLYWPVLNDSTGAVFASYGLHKCHGISSRLVLLTPTRHIRRWLDSASSNDENFQQKLETIMTTSVAESVAQETPWSIPHAPILLIPNVLSPEECQTLISTFHPDVPLLVRPPKGGEFSGDYQIPVYEHNRQDRVDQIIKNKNNLAFLDQRIWGRVTPAIKKAFAFDVTRREDLHIARYKGERSGNHMGHRDNTTAAAAYRRFAFSMNLNDDYEGGELVFKEYSTRGYRAAPGTAMVFSSSLLHEVMATTKGTRYNLISHFFNEQSLQEFQK